MNSLRPSERACPFCVLSSFDAAIGLLSVRIALRRKNTGRDATEALAASVA
jgi:hypothetical protein